MFLMLFHSTANWWWNILKSAVSSSWWWDIIMYAYRVCKNWWHILVYAYCFITQRSNWWWDVLMYANFFGITHRSRTDDQMFSCMLTVSKHIDRTDDEMFSCILTVLQHHDRADDEMFFSVCLGLVFHNTGSRWWHILTSAHCFITQRADNEIFSPR